MTDAKDRREGQTLFDLRRLEFENLNGAGFTAKVVDGRDASRFRIDFDSQLCVVTPDACLLDDISSRFVNVRFAKNRKPTWASIRWYTPGESVTAVISDGFNDVDVAWPDQPGFAISNSTGLASANGRKFFTTIPKDGRISLWTFEIDSDFSISSSTCLSADSKLPTGIEALATSDGENFLVAGYENRTDFSERHNKSTQSRFLWKMKLNADGTFHLESQRRLELKTDRIRYVTMTDTGVLRIGWDDDGLPVRSWSTNHDRPNQEFHTFGLRGMEHQALSDWPLDDKTPNDPTRQSVIPIRINIKDWRAHGVTHKTMVGGTFRTISVRNRSGRRLMISWIDFEGEHQIIRQLEPDAEIQITTYVGHTLEFRTTEGQLWDAFNVLEYMPPIDVRERRDVMWRQSWSW